MPLPNEHSCRKKDPSGFQPDSFRRVTRDHNGKEYSVIMGKLKGKDTMTEQAYRYKKTIWSADEARSHCKSHDGNFEAASEGASSENISGDGQIDNIIIEKEEIMDVNTLKEKHPEIYTDVFNAGKEEGAKGGTMEQKIKDLEAQVEALTAENKNLVEDNKSLDKEISTTKAKAQAEKESAQAETIMTEVLQASAIAEGLHSKVKAMISYGNHRKEDGTFDAETFSTAFKAEVADWEAKVKPEGSLGLGGDGKKDGIIDGLEAAKAEWKKDLGYE